MGVAELAPGTSFDKDFEIVRPLRSDAGDDASAERAMRLVPRYWPALAELDRGPASAPDCKGPLGVDPEGRKIYALGCAP